MNLKSILFYLSLSTEFISQLRLYIHDYFFY